MKKKVFYLIVIHIAIFPQLLFSQTVISDVAYRCQYRVITVKDTLDSNFISQDFMNLDIGKNISVFYSSRKAERDAFRKKTKEQGFLDMDRVKATPKGVNNYRIYMNYPTNKITYQDELVGRKNKYFYEEDFIPFQWKMTTDKTKILKYACQKATCNYMGRDYEAWFTTEIPIKYGPYKFNGLPGLILKLYDAKKQYIFEAIGFEQLKESESILYDVKGFQKISKPDFLKIQYSFITDPINFISQSLGVKIEGISTPQDQAKERFHPDAYLPIERIK